MKLKTFTQWMNEENKPGINIAPGVVLTGSDGKKSTVSTVKKDGNTTTYTVKDSTGKESEFVDAAKDANDKRPVIGSVFQLNVK